MLVKTQRRGRKFCSFWITHRYITIWFWMKIKLIAYRSSGAYLPMFQWGDFTQLGSQEATAYHLTMSWLDEVYKGVKILTYWKCYTSFRQSVIKISVCVNTQKIMKLQLLNIVINHSAYFTQQHHSFINKQWLRPAHT